jgi:hypothetical protein
LIQLGCIEDYLASERIRVAAELFPAPPNERMAIRRNVARFSFRAILAPPAEAGRDQ